MSLLNRVKTFRDIQIISMKIPAHVVLEDIIAGEPLHSKGDHFIGFFYILYHELEKIKKTPKTKVIIRLKDHLKEYYRRVI